MKIQTEERRRHARLPLHYTIRVRLADTDERVCPHMLTTDVSPTGAHFRTFGGIDFEEDALVQIAIEVPHRRGWDGRDAQLKLCGPGRVVRIEGPGEHGPFGEDGRVLRGVALEFVRPLELSYRWL